MSLNFPVVSSQMNDIYTGLKLDKQSDNVNQVPYPKAPGTQWVVAFKMYYDSDSIAGTFSKASVVMVSRPALLDFINTGNSCASAPTNMAKVITDYWVSQLAFGTPQILTSIVSITNDASKINAPIKDYLCTQVSTLKTPSYNHIFQYIENQVKSIIWTVTEKDSTTTTSYPVTIS